MKNNKKKYVISILICVTIAAFFSYGLKQRQPVEDLDIISAIGQDIKINGTNIDYIVPFSVYLFEPQEKLESTLKIGTATNVGETRQTRQLGNDNKSVLGFEKIYVLSQEYAFYGISNTMDILFRNPYLNDTAYMMVCKGSALNMLNMKIKEYPSSGDFIEGLIRNAKNYNFFSNKYRVMDLFFTVDCEGCNLVLPYIEITDKGIQVTGMALFKKDKMVTKISVDDLKSMNILRENDVKGILSIQKNPKEYINYYATSQKKVFCTKEGNKYKFTININLKGDIISDTLHKNLQKSPEKNAEFNKTMAEYVKKTCNDFIIKMKNEYKVDCLNLGQVAAAKYGRHTGVDWNSIVCNSEIDVNVKVKVQKTGRGDY